MPALSPHFFKLGPVPFSDKATTYSLAAALALCTGARSLLAAGAALAFGLAYTLPGPGRGLQAVRLPRAAVDAVWAVAGPLLGGDPADADLTAGGAAAAAGGRAGSPRGAGGADDDDGSDGGDGAGGAGGAGGGGAGADEGEPLGPEPSDEAVARVAAMGFPPAAVRDALRRSFGDEAAAVGRLVGT